MGQIFTSKYNFVFNTSKKQIGFYKSVNNKKEKDKKNKIVIIKIFIFLGLLLLFIIIGIFLGTKIFGQKRKIIANELTDGKDYEYKSNEENNYKTNNDVQNYYNSENVEDTLGLTNGNIN